MSGWGGNADKWSTYINGDAKDHESGIFERSLKNGIIYFNNRSEREASSESYESFQSASEEVTSQSCQKKTQKAIFQFFR